MSQDAANARLRLVIADDHAMFLQAMRHLLEQEGSIDVVGSAADGEALMRVIAQHSPDIALVDISMPGPPAPRPVSLARGFYECRARRN